MINLNLIKKRAFTSVTSITAKQSSFLLSNNLRKFNFCENSSYSSNSSSNSKILKIELDENGERKVVYQDFKEHINKTGKQDNRLRKIKTQVSKIKFFGSESKDVPEEVFDFDKDITTNTEEVKENLIKYDQYFSDYCRVYIKAGDGGNGLISFIKGPMFNDRTPQGGDGGKGGDVIFVADETVNSLSSLRKAHFFGNPGQKGRPRSMGGKNGGDITIHLPVGTIVNEILREEDYKFKKKELRSDKNFRLRQLVDLDSHGKKFVVCRGGRAGIGNVTKRNITQETKSLKGQQGEEMEIELILKCLADIGLIGYPNAGKSTLLAALTRAVPKIAPYPFTTLHPHIGKLKFNEAFTLTVADLPGLIEGAHQNKGLGHKFLKHVERTKILLIVLDGSLDPYEKRSPLNDLNSLFNELSLFNKSYSDKPFLVALNKCDTDNENHEINLGLLRNSPLLKGKDIYSISGKEGIGLEELTIKLKQIADSINISKA